MNETDHGEAPPVGLNCGATSPPRLTRSGLGRGLTWSLHSLTRSNSKRGNARQGFGKKSRPWNRVGQEPNTIPSAPPYGHSHFDLTDQALAAAAPERRWFDSPPLRYLFGGSRPDRFWLLAFPAAGQNQLVKPIRAGVRAPKCDDSDGCVGSLLGRAVRLWCPCRFCARRFENRPSDGRTNNQQAGLTQREFSLAR